MLRPALRTSGHRFALVLLGWLLLIQPSRAQSGSTDCSRSLQARLDAAPAGSVLALPACIFRETVFVNKPLTIDGRGAAELRGSDVWSAWAPSGQYWRSVQVVPDLGTDSVGAMYVDAAAAFGANHLEQVFVDGGPSLVQVPASPVTGQFALDASRHVILPSDPAGHTVEVTTRAHWAITNADDVTITNMTFRHAATASQAQAIGNDDHVRYTLERSTLTDAHGTMVGVGGRAGPVLLAHNVVARAGDLGIAGYLGVSDTLDSNDVSDSGFGGWDPGWQSGGVKLSSMTDLTVKANTVYGNYGSGLWCDIGCDGATYAFNQVHDNRGPQIHFEVSQRASIHDNSVWNALPNRQMPSIGIFLSSSANVEVTNNTVSNKYAADGIVVIDDKRADKPAASGKNVNVHDNRVIQGVDGTMGLKWWDYGSGVVTDPASNNHGTDNRFWYGRPETGQQRFEFGPNVYGSIAAFARTSGGAGSVYMSRSEADAALAGLDGAGTPATPTATPTVVPATVTATATVTASATAASATATATLTPTDMTTPTPSATPDVVASVTCRVSVEINGTPGPYRPC